MGVALAEEARARGAEVTLLAANLAVAPPGRVELVETPTAEIMRREAVARAEAVDAVIMAAAVADYRPANARADKRPKDEAAWTLELEPTADIVRELASRPRDGQVIVAFGAELGAEGLARKRGMLADKRVDLVVLNDVARPDTGFDAEENEVVLVSAEGERRLAKAPKRVIAAAIVDEVAARLR
jgi:phosphopantothenoylcysteine decarboxylase/phosphopantothenate--cysteine ligase